MDRNTVLGFVLIGLVLMIWMYFNAPTAAPPQLPRDSIATSKADSVGIGLAERSRTRLADTSQSLGKYFSQLKLGRERIITIETNQYRAEISTRGGSIRSWILKRYQTWNQYPVDLINSNNDGDFHLMFYTSDGKLINTKNLYFESSVSNSDLIKVPTADSVRLDFVMNVTPQSKLIKSFIFYGNTYSFDAAFRFENLDSVLSNFTYYILWDSGIRYQERNSVHESSFAKAAGYAGGELTEVDANKLNEVAKQNISGRVMWVATRNKYFAIAIIPREKESEGAYLEGIRTSLPDQGVMEAYKISLKMPFTGKPTETDRVTVFLGPLDFDVVRGYNAQLEKIMSLGAAWIIRPISENIIIPLFRILHHFIPNYGIVLIVFSVIVKIALYPLTKTSMRSMQKMQALQPMMNEIREKFKDDPQRMNQQIMRLYKEYGVNPAGGCLPTLLQLPILYALWAVFSSTIELRQAPFTWWIKDLSIPDAIGHFPFRIPLFGIEEISGLAVLMGITMFVQQRMSIRDPRQQAMVWVMPVLLTLMFNGFPSGLNLYYFVFNVLSISQQYWINKQHKNDPLRKIVPEKSAGGFITKLARNMSKKNRIN